MSQKTEHHEGKIGAFLNMIVTLIKRNPIMLDNVAYLRSNLELLIPALKNKSVCPNCGASMKEYIYQFDAWDALLLIAMAKTVRDRRRQDLAFTLANQVRIPELPVSHAVRCRTTQAGKLGLVAELRASNGKRIPGVWVITRRGWSALKGDPVPRRVRVWRKQIEERYEDTITIRQALKSHTEYVQKSISRGRKPKEDHRQEIESFNPSEWLEWGLHQGDIF